MELESIVLHFLPQEKDFKINALNSGHINSTFKVIASQHNYILQKVNTSIFTEPENIAYNHLVVNKLLDNSSYSKSSSKPVLSEFGHYFHKDKNGEFWRMQEFISDSKTYLKVPSAEVAFEAAKCFSEFYFHLNNKPQTQLKEVLPGFIDFEKRLKDFYLSLKSGSPERIEEAQQEIQWLNDHKSLLSKWNDLIELKLLPLRLIHADPKISNLLFDSENKALAVIDLDTVMESTILYDFGDMVRSYTNLYEEDDASNLDNFSKEIFESTKRGFLFYLKNHLSKTEIEHLDAAAKAVVYIQAARFLTDYLQNDRYYKIDYDKQNLNRAKNQINLLKNILNFI